MKPIVDMACPLPSTEARPHGMKHCQRYSPGPGVMKLKVVVVWVVDMAQGPCVHWFFAVYRTPSNGTLMPSSGALNVWATPHVVSELTSEMFFPLTPSASPLTDMTLPTVPLTRPLNWLRSGSQ